MICALADLSDKFTDFEQNISGFVKNVSSNKLPHYLQPGNNFLGKFQIEAVMSYQKLQQFNGHRNASVFDQQNGPASAKDNESRRSDPSSRKMTSGRRLNKIGSANAKDVSSKGGVSTTSVEGPSKQDLLIE